MKTVITFGKPQLNRLFLVSIITLLCTSHVFGVTTYTWNGNTSSDWNTAANWTASSGPSAVPTSANPVKIGTSTFTNQPVVKSAAAAAASITFGTKKAATLTVNSGYTLTVTGAITQNAAAQTYTTTLAGNGSITCGSIAVGDNTTVPVLSISQLQVISTIANLHVAGNVAINSTSTSIIIIGIGLNNASFSLQGGTMQIDGTIFTANTKVGLIPLVNASPSFTVDMPSGSSLSPILQLSNTAPLNTASVSGSIDFYNNTGGTGTSTVYYNGASQTVYTNQTACLDNSPQTYQNLILTGTGTATVGTGTGSTLSVGNDLTTSANTTDLSAYNPTVTIGDDWVNTGNVTGGAGNITVTNLLQNTAGIITLAGGATTIGTGGIQLSGGSLIAGTGTLTDNGAFLNTGGLLNCGTAANGSVIFKGNYTNSSGTFTANPASTSSVYFSGTTQTLQDNSNSGTTFNNVTFNSTTATINSGTGNFGVASTGILTMGTGVSLTAGSISAGGAGYLTLLSSDSSTASVPKIPASSSIKGAVNVQRYITGGTGTRGYRLITSPVNISLANTGNLSLAYLNANAPFGGVPYLGAFTEGPGTGFTYNGSYNPIIYLYDESRPTNNSAYTAGKNIGIYSIIGNTVTTLTSGVQSAPGAISIPVGNSYLFYYVGDNHLTDQTAVSASRTPESISITATGYLNQGSVPVKFWNNGSTSIPYDVTSGTSYPGINQVGNPYASTIDLTNVYADNNTVNPVFWELVPGASYVSYNVTNGHVSDGRASKYILSGQGFLVEASAPGETLTFNESEKTAYPTGLVTPFNTAATTALLMSIPSKPGLSNNDITAAAAMPQQTSFDETGSGVTGLHLQITKDSLNHVQTGIYFDSSGNDNYNQSEDAITVNGSGAQVFLSSYTADNVNVGINQLADYTNGKRIKLYTGVTSSGSYSLSLADIANIDTDSYSVFLVDKKLNDSLDMVHNKSYTFSINNSDTSTYGANRFVLAIEQKTLPGNQLFLFYANKITPKSGLIIYPNPSKSIINISLATNAPANYSADIYNTSGMLIKHESLNTDTWTEDISNYKLGVYFIELKDTNGYQLGEAKFVKTN